MPFESQVCHAGRCTCTHVQEREVDEMWSINSIQLHSLFITVSFPRHLTRACGNTLLRHLYKIKNGMRNREDGREEERKPEDNGGENTKNSPGGRRKYVSGSKVA